MTNSFKKVNGITGMKDILPDSSYQWNELEAILRAWTAQYGYLNIRTPILEQTRLFSRGIGEVTDIVEKEMYSFTDSLNGDQLTMRPEFTAGVVRSAIEHNLLYQRPQRLYTMGPVFRHERPQRGRYRQFHQISVEALGFSGPDIDAELIVMADRLWKQLGLSNIRLELNTLGQYDERKAHRSALIEYLEKNANVLDEDSKRRMYTNPLRVLDTKNPDLQDMADNAPVLFDFLGSESKDHFAEVCNRLEDAGISYSLNPRLVRGLDYYNLTVFEWVTDSLGAQGTVCGGGRYDDLFSLLGGKDSPAAGFAIGLERLLDLWTQSNTIKESSECHIYIIHQGEGAQRRAAVLAESLRDDGYRVVVHSGPTGFRAQFRRADSSGATIALIIGDEELAQSAVSIKWLRQTADDNSQQQLIPMGQLAEFLKSKGVAAWHMT